MLIEYNTGSNPDVAKEFSGEDEMAGGHQDPVQDSKTQLGRSLDNQVGH